MGLRAVCAVRIERAREHAGDVSDDRVKRGSQFDGLGCARLRHESFDLERDPLGAQTEKIEKEVMG